MLKQFGEQMVDRMLRGFFWVVSLVIPTKRNPQDQEMIDRLLAANKQDEQELDDAVKAFISDHPVLGHAQFDLPFSLPPHVFWVAGDVVGMHLQRFERHELNDQGIEFELCSDGTILVNGAVAIPDETIVREVYQCCRSAASSCDVFSEVTAARLVTWLVAALHIEPRLIRNIRARVKADSVFLTPIRYGEEHENVDRLNLAVWRGKATTA